MKIVHVIPSLNPADGGPPMVAARLAAAQSGLGHETHLLAYHFPETDGDTKAALAGVPNIQRVGQHVIPGFNWVEHYLPSEARDTAVPLIKGADLVHLHGVWDPMILAISRECLRQKRPYVVTPHSMLNPWSLKQKPVKKRLALAFVYRAMLNKAAFLHYLNADELRMGEELKLTAPTRIFPNGVFMEEIEPLPQRGTFRATVAGLGDKPMVLFLGRLHFKKGLDILADAFARMLERIPEARLVVAGPDFGAKETLVDQVRQLRLEERVHFVGALFGARKISALVDCDCFCLPSRQEAFSVAVTEAMACGKPVVISQACHFPEVAEVGAGVVTELDSGEVAEGICRVLAEGKGAEMGRAGRKIVVERYTWPIIARGMTEAYLEAIG